MEEKIFREKSLEQLSAPEQLTSYLRVTGPGIWIMLAGIVILLGGLLVWGCFGTIYSTVTAPALIRNGKASCYLLDEDAERADRDITIGIGDVKITASVSDAGTVILDASDDPFLYESGYLSPGKKVRALSGETELKDGNYNASVTVETLKPISLLLGRS